MRHLHKGDIKWHPATDKLEGTSVYGDPSDDSVAWSIKFDDIHFNQFMFANEYFTKWIVAEREEIIPKFNWYWATNYGGVYKMWLRSEINPTAPALLRNQIDRAFWTRMRMRKTKPLRMLPVLLT